MSSCCCCLSASAILSSSGTVCSHSQERQGSIIVLLGLFRSYSIQLLWHHFHKDRQRQESMLNTIPVLSFSCISPVLYPSVMHYHAGHWVCSFTRSPLVFFYSCSDTRGCGSSCSLQDVVNSCQCCFIVTSQKLHAASLSHHWCAVVVVCGFTL